MSSPQQPYGGGWSGGDWQPPSEQTNYPVASGPPGYQPSAPQGFEAVGYGQPSYPQYGQPQAYDQPQQYDQPYPQQPGYPPPGPMGPGGPGGPGYGPPGMPPPGYGPPKQTNWLPWVLGGGGALLVIIVVVVIIAGVALSGGDDGGTATTDTSTSTSARAEGGTYQPVGNLCDTMDISPLNSIGTEKGDVDHNETKSSDYSFLSCSMSVTGPSETVDNNVSLTSSAEVYSEPSDAEQSFSSRRDSSKDATSGEFSDVSGVGDKAYGVYYQPSDSDDYIVYRQEVGVLDDNAVVNVSVIVSSDEQISRDDARQMVVDMINSVLTKMKE